MTTKTGSDWGKEFDERFHSFADDYYNFVVGKNGTKWENIASDLDDIKAFITRLQEQTREELKRKFFTYLFHNSIENDLKGRFATEQYDLIWNKILDSQESEGK